MMKKYFAIVLTAVCAHSAWANGLESLEALPRAEEPEKA